MKIGIAVALFLLFAPVAIVGQCPAINVIGPSGLTVPGDKMVFVAVVGVVGPKLEYSWTIDRGIIVEGQGTPAITVATNRTLAGEKLTASVKVDGLPSSCDRTASESAGIISPSEWCWELDSWEHLKPDDERGRLDTLFAELSNNPSQIGFFIMRVTSKEKFDSTNSRIQFILKHAKFRGFDKDRLWFALELAEEVRTSVGRMPPDGELPCSECQIIKGEHI